MRLSKLNIRKISFNEIDSDYSAQNILIKLGELYQFESGIYGYGNIWTKLERNIEKIIIEELDKADCIQVEFPKLQPRSIWDKNSIQKKLLNIDLTNSNVINDGFKVLKKDITLLKKMKG